MPAVLTAIEEHLHSDALAAICQRHHVRELSLFGSAATGQFEPGSDVDLLVEFEPDALVGLIELGTMAEELAELVQHPVDLVPKAGLKPLVRDRVLRESEVLFAAR